MAEFSLYFCGDVIDVIYNVIAQCVIVIFLLFTVCIFWIVVIFQLKWKIFLQDVRMKFFGQIESVFKF